MMGREIVNGATALRRVPLPSRKVSPRRREQRPHRDEFAELAAFATRGELTPVVDRVYPLADTAEAIRYIATGHARGKVLIAVQH